ncbi:MAG TPA: hypothetical protein VNB91_15070 [Jatrophihabitantaceae bacterium]|jgi:hypothetical protein|nr:hypothetical protein [Jatrophihabitantaceae bacterium]
MTSTVAHAHHENPHAGQGPVVLDIGGDIGALVIAMPEAMAGVEIEIRSVDERAHCAHVGVVGRPAEGQTVWSAVFPELYEGRYELYERVDGRPQLAVDITGGEVTQASWPQ